jgi:cell division protein FtsW
MTRPFTLPARRRAAVRVPTRATGKLDAPQRETATTRPAMRGVAVRAFGPAAFGLMALAVVLIASGLVFVASASSIQSLNRYGTSWYVFRRQLQWIVIGLAVGASVMFIPYRLWRRLAPLMFGVSLFATFLTLTPIGHSRGGSRRWLGPEAIAVQPSELLKLALVFMLASLSCQRSVHLESPRAVTQYFVRPLTVVAAMAILPVLAQPDMGTAGVLVVIFATIAVAAGMPGRSLGRLALGAAVLTFAFAKFEPYRWDRVVAFLRPGHDLQGIGYHVYQSKLGFASGGLFGRGFGASRAKWGFLPNAHTDFIFAVIGEETGLLGAVVMLGLYGALIFIGMHVARRARERFASLVAAAITTWIASQALFNIGAVLGSLPVTGVPLPFVSVGGSSFIVLMAATGVLVNIARTGLVDRVTADAERRQSARPSRSVRTAT